MFTICNIRQHTANNTCVRGMQETLPSDWSSLTWALLCSLSVSPSWHETQGVVTIISWHQTRHVWHTLLLGSGGNWESKGPSLTESFHLTTPILHHRKVGKFLVLLIVQLASWMLGLGQPIGSTWIHNCGVSKIFNLSMCCFMHPWPRNHDFRKSTSMENSFTVGSGKVWGFQKCA